MFPVVKALVEKKPEMLKDMACVFEEDAVDVLRAKSAVTLALDAYADSISTMPRMGRGLTLAPLTFATHRCSAPSGSYRIGPVASFGKRRF